MLGSVPLDAVLLHAATLACLVLMVIFDVRRRQTGAIFALRVGWIVVVETPFLILIWLDPWMDWTAAGLPIHVRTFWQTATDADHRWLGAMTFLCALPTLLVKPRGYRQFEPRVKTMVIACDGRMDRIRFRCFTALTIATILVFAASTGVALMDLVGYSALELRMGWNETDRPRAAMAAFSVLGALCPFLLTWLFVDFRRQAFTVLSAALLTLPALLLMGSRRAMIVPVIPAFLTLVSFRRTRLSLVVMTIATVGFAIILVFGRGLLRESAGVSQTDLKEVRSSRIVDQAGYTFIELSRSQLASLGTIMYYKEQPRLGIDHLYSAMRPLPEQSLFGFEFPRFVRESTLFLTGDAETNDVPPGFVGMAWADGRWLGFLALPALLPLLAWWIDRWLFSSHQTAYSASCLFAICFIIFFQTLGTGTLDYSLAPESLLVSLVGTYGTVFWSRNRCARCLTLPS